jgi:hypothetical protein
VDIQAIYFALFIEGAPFGRGVEATTQALLLKGALYIASSGLNVSSQLHLEEFQKLFTVINNCGELNLSMQRPLIA